MDCFSLYWGNISGKRGIMCNTTHFMNYIILLKIVLKENVSRYLKKFLKLQYMFKEGVPQSYLVSFGLNFKNFGASSALFNV